MAEQTRGRITARIPLCLPMRSCTWQASVCGTGHARKHDSFSPANLQIITFSSPSNGSSYLFSPPSPQRTTSNLLCSISILSLFHFLFQLPTPDLKMKEGKPLKTPRSRRSETKSNSCNHLTPHAIRPLQRHEMLWIAA